MPEELKTGKNYFKKRAFIATFRKTLNVQTAAKAAGIEPREHYEWLKHDNYRVAWGEVQEDLAQTLEDEAVRRAMGVQHPVLYKGKVVRTGRGRSSRIVYDVEYSDQLLIMLLKRFRPALYRERTVTEVTGSVEIIDRLNSARARLVKMQTNDQPSGTAG